MSVKQGDYYNSFQNSQLMPNNIDNGQDSQVDLDNEETREKAENIAKKIKKEKSEWAREKGEKKKEFKAKTLKGLKDSRQFFVNKKSEMSADFEPQARKKVLEIIEDIKAIGGGDDEVQIVKDAYFEYLDSLIACIDEEIEKRESNQSLLNKSEQEDSIEQEIKDEIVKWENNNLRSRKKLIEKDKSSLEAYIVRLRKKIDSYQNNWDQNAPISCKNFIKKLRKFVDVARIAQIKNTFIIGKEDLLADAERLLWEMNNESSSVDEKKAKKEIENLSEKEKKTLLEGVVNFGYWTQKTKSRIMGSMMNWMAQATSKNKNLQNYFNEYSNIYKEDEERASQAIEIKEKGIKKKTIGAAQGAGNVMKYGRIIYDVFDSSSVRALNPFRHATAIAMFFGRSSEALKRQIINGEVIKEKTRIKDQEEAMREAERIFRINLKENGSTALNKEDLERIYREQLPEDIMERMNREGGIQGARWLQFLFQRDVKIYANRILKKIEKLEKSKKSDEEKEKKRKQIMQKYNALLKDLDVMVTHEGMVDNLAYLSRVVEKTGKGVANALIIDSVARLAQGVYEMDIFGQAWNKGEEYNKKFYEFIEKNFVQKFDSSANDKNIFSKIMKKAIDSVLGDNAYDDIKNNFNPKIEPEPSTDVSAGTISIDDSSKAKDSEDTLETADDGAIGDNSEVEKGIASGINEAMTHQDTDQDSDESSVQNQMDKEIVLNAEGIPDINDSNKNSGFDAKIAHIKLANDSQSSEHEGLLNQDSGKVSKLAVGEQIKLATIQASQGANSIEGVFIKQLQADPRNFGFKGDIDDSDEIKQWAGRQAHRIAIDNGYFDPKTGQGIWMKASSIDHNAYVLKNINGSIGVDEYMDGKLRESHIPGVDFENANIEKNEYVHQTSHPVEEQAVNQNAVEAEAAADDEQKEILENYASYGISPEDLEKVGIDIKDGFSEEENLKHTYLIDSVYSGVKDKAVNVITMADKIGTTDFEMVSDYYYQLQNLEGNVIRQQGLLDFLTKKGDARLALSKIFNLEIPEGRLEIKDGRYVLKNVEKMLDIVVVNDGGEIKFGVDGPWGKWNWGAGGRSWIFRADALLTNENINKALDEIKKMAAHWRKS